MAKNPIIDVIRRAFAAYETQDRDLIESLIAEDFHFTSPQDDHIDRAEYFRRCWPNSGQFRSITVEKIFARGRVNDGARDDGARDDGARGDGARGDGARGDGARGDGEAGGDEAFVRYVGETKDGKRFRNVEWHCMRNGKLVEVEVYFGRTLAEGE